MGACAAVVDALCPLLAAGGGEGVLMPSAADWGTGGLRRGA